MRTFIYSFGLSMLFLFSACGTYFKSLDINQLRLGMTKAEVYRLAGNPERILVAKHTSEGYLEVLEYINTRQEAYALEFWNDYLTGYEFLYQNTNNPNARPPATNPGYGYGKPPHQNQTYPYNQNYQPNSKPITKPQTNTSAPKETDKREKEPTRRAGSTSTEVNRDTQTKEPTRSSNNTKSGAEQTEETKSDTPTRDRETSTRTSRSTTSN